MGAYPLRDFVHQSRGQTSQVKVEERSISQRQNLATLASLCTCLCRDAPYVHQHFLKLKVKRQSIVYKLLNPVRNLSAIPGTVIRKVHLNGYVYLSVVVRMGSIDNRNWKQCRSVKKNVHLTQVLEKSGDTWREAKKLLRNGKMNYSLTIPSF